MPRNGRGMANGMKTCRPLLHGEVWAIIVSQILDKTCEISVARHNRFGAKELGADCARCGFIHAYSNATTIPSAMAISVVAISSVRRLNRQGSHDEAASN